VPATKPIDELRQEAAKLIVQHMRKIGISKAASELEISRQALYDIEDGKYCPSLALIQRACEAWDLQFHFRGIRIDKRTLHRKKPLNVAQPTQAELIFEALESIEKQRVEIVRAKRQGKAVELVFRLTISA